MTQGQIVDGSSGQVRSTEMQQGDLLLRDIDNFCVDQDYGRYTSSDQETWRLAMDQLQQTLVDRTAVEYQNSFASVGLNPYTIPNLEEMNAALEKFDWKVVTVDGFIPPTSFMRFQANCALPVTRFIRSRSQLDYTPAPDIIHEAAGHLPMLVNPDYRNFLKRLGTIGAKAELTDLDTDIYRNQKRHADLMATSGTSNSKEIQEIEWKLNQLRERRRCTTPSPATMVARFHWWTVEYGLIGKSGKIFGAGLLSSAKESRLTSGFEKKRLTIDCVYQDFDITHMQPVLYVADDWQHIDDTMHELEVECGQV